MSKIVDKMRTQARTGQRSNGGCGPVPATQPQTWGAACPTGDCTAADLATNLNRAFAGERYGCRELPYTLVGQVDAGGNVSISENSKVTMCPTRVEISLDDGVVTPNDATLDSFEIGNQNQLIGDPIPFDQLAPDSYQPIPFVTDCIRAGLPFSLKLTAPSPLTVGDFVYVTLIGPAIG